MYLSVRADDDLSQMVVHGSHGLTDRVQGHVHLPLHSVSVGEQPDELHHDLVGQNQQRLIRFPVRKVSGNVSQVVTRL